MGINTKIKQFCTDFIKGYLFNYDPFVINSDLNFKSILNIGDCLDDEWFIADLLFQISLMGCICQVWDSDGQFLLIESCDYHDFDVENNNLFIYNGNLYLLDANESIPEFDWSIISKFNSNTLLSRDIHECVLKRCRKRIPLHKTIVSIPYQLAQILSKNPQILGRAIEAFTSRTPKETKLDYFKGDCIDFTVTMTRFWYAKLVHSTKLCETLKIDLGLKIKCGLEILNKQDPLEIPNIDVSRELVKDDDSWLSIDPKAIDDAFEFIQETDQDLDPEKLNRMEKAMETVQDFFENSSDIRGFDPWDDSDSELEPVNFDADQFILSLKESLGETDHELIRKMSEMDSELSSTNIEKVQDIDINLAENLLKSLEAQDGLSGPASNILNSLSSKVPR